jgi:hypothetical protein
VSGGTPDFDPISLGTGNRAFAQPVIAGGEVYVVTDSDIEPNGSTYGRNGDTGLLSRFSLQDGSAIGTTTVLRSGVGGVDASSGHVWAMATGGITHMDFTSDFQLGGAGAERENVVKITRRLWLGTI